MYQTHKAARDKKMAELTDANKEVDKLRYIVSETKDAEGKELPPGVAKPFDAGGAQAAMRSVYTELKRNPSVKLAKQAFPAIMAAATKAGVTGAERKRFLNVGTPGNPVYLDEYILKMSEGEDAKDRQANAEKAKKAKEQELEKELKAKERVY
jgi:hypothetical protein